MRKLRPRTSYLRAKVISLGSNKRNFRFRRTLRYALFYILLCNLVSLHYCMTRGILRDGKVRRILPRTLKELCRDFCVSRSSRIARLRTEKPIHISSDPSIVVLSLRRTPWRVRRLEVSLRSSGVEFTVINAIDGSKSFVDRDIDIFAGRQRQRVVQRLSREPERVRDRVSMRNSQFACFLTHVHVWEELLSSTLPYVVVLEDDVVLAGRFKERLLDALRSLPTSWDILYLNSTNPYVHGHLRNDIYYLKGALGTYGYAISKQGAITMLHVARKSDKPIDHLLDQAIYQGRINAFHILPAIVTHDDAFKSTIRSFDHEN